MCHQCSYNTTENKNTVQNSTIVHPSAPGIYFYVTTPHLIIIKE